MTKAELKYYSGLNQKKFRDRENKFLIEGEHIISECIRSKYYKDMLEKVFVREDYGNDKLTGSIRKSIPGIDIVSVSENNFNKLSGTVNSQGIIGVVRKSVKDKEISLRNERIIVALDSVNDPGNLGTIIRTCHWFGADQILLGNDSVEISNPKVIRASQGSVFNVNILDELDLKSVLEKYFRKGYDVLLSDLNSENYLDEFILNINKKYVIVFGNEANGISKDILKNSDFRKLKIRGFSDCESLNLSVSAGIILYSFRDLKN